MKSLIGRVFCIYAFSFMPSILFAAANCGTCATTKADLGKSTQEKARMLQVKHLNEEYLKTHPDASVSVQVKARSNCIQAAIKAETFQNEITFLTAKITKECVGCP